MAEERDPTASKATGTPRTRKKAKAETPHTEFAFGLTASDAFCEPSSEASRKMRRRTPTPPPPRRPGRLRGQFVVGPEFFEPVSDVEEREFFGE